MCPPLWMREMRGQRQPISANRWRASLRRMRCPAQSVARRCPISKVARRLSAPTAASKIAAATEARLCVPADTEGACAVRRLAVETAPGGRPAGYRTRRSLALNPACAGRLCGPAGPSRRGFNRQHARQSQDPGSVKYRRDAMQRRGVRPAPSPRRRTSRPAGHPGAVLTASPRPRR
jgi:hypothetical protein